MCSQFSNLWFSFSNPCSQFSDLCAHGMPFFCNSLEQLDYQMCFWMLLWWYKQLMKCLVDNLWKLKRHTNVTNMGLFFSHFPCIHIQLESWHNFSALRYIFFISSYRLEVTASIIRRRNQLQKVKSYQSNRWDICDFTWE